MNWDRIQGRWKELKGDFKQRFSKLTDDDLMNLDGKKDTLLGKLQQRYGYGKDVADRELNSWMDAIEKRFDKV